MSADTNDAVTEVVYDAEGRLTQTTVLDDGTSNLVTTTDYDHAGRATATHVDPGSGPHLNLTTSYLYDADGNVLHVTNQVGDVTTNGYDNANRRTPRRRTRSAASSALSASAFPKPAVSHGSNLIGPR
jgi:YD repeat-containing protein